MKTSYKWLQSYFDAKLPEPEALSELIGNHAFEVESVEKVGDDTVFDIKVLPDRAHYALCHRGIAREIRAITGLVMKDEKSSSIKITDPTTVNVSIDDYRLCRRYVARRISGVQIGEAPRWLKERLEAIGSRSINNIVDATNYVMFDIGQPLHAFDADRTSQNIYVRLAGNGEEMELLPETVMVDGKATEKERKITLDQSNLVIADDGGAIALAGVKGGRKAEINSGTKNIIIESANFDPVSIRRTSTRMGIRNDSSKRFENEIIPELAGEAMDRITQLIVDMCPDAKISNITDQKYKETRTRNISVHLAFINERIGENIDRNTARDLLERVGCDIVERDHEFLVTPPIDRLDMNIPEDVVDEVARLYGYDIISGMEPAALRQKTPVDKTFYLSEKFKNILNSLGYNETLLYSLVPKGSFVIEYPLASDKSALRESIIPEMSGILVTNARNAELLGLDMIKIFEIGKVFPSTGEKTSLAIGITIVKKRKGINAESEVKIIIDRLSKDFPIGAGDITYKKVDPMTMLAEIDFDNVVNKIHEVGAVSDLDFAVLPEDKRYVPFSQYPFIGRDVAVFVPENVTAENVWQVIESGLKKSNTLSLVAKHALFDIFKKDAMTSYAFRIIFQASDRTLTDDEVNRATEAIYSALKEKNWQIR
ncbi:MAG: phenylalanine--tRNA ligase subunit beta [Patescibacteria group bacterium]|nr:phenylalanine--tRNA ligase subunit beta [Patescibacteria group bacterium]